MFLFSPEDLLVDFRERGREGEREGNIDDLPLAGALTNQGPNLQPRHVL